MNKIRKNVPNSGTNKDGSGVLGDLKTREEVMEEIRNSPRLYSEFLDLNEEFQKRFVEFCMGVRGAMMTYDPFFQKIFNVETHPERLSDFISHVIGKKLVVKRALPKEHSRISEKGSLLIMDILAETEEGELVNVEIQKVGYRFPGQRTACYVADMIMRQYEREKSLRGKEFTYKDMKKVYTIVIMETSSREFNKYPNDYIHQGAWGFNTGLELELLADFSFIPLDIFFQIEDNKGEETEMTELEAWLYFIGSDKPEHIEKVLAFAPKFEEMYREIFYFRKHPEEAIGMFSEALKEMDENTVKYMIEEMKEEYEEVIDKLEKAEGKLEEAEGKLEEAEGKLEEAEGKLEEAEGKLEETEGKLEEKDKEIERLLKLLAEKEK